MIGFGKASELIVRMSWKQCSAEYCSYYLRHCVLQHLRFLWQCYRRFTHSLILCHSFVFSPCVVQAPRFFTMPATVYSVTQHNIVSVCFVPFCAYSEVSLTMHVFVRSKNIKPSYVHVYIWAIAIFYVAHACMFSGAWSSSTSSCIDERAHFYFVI